MYANEMKFDDWALLAENGAGALQSQLELNQRNYAKWYAYAYGKTDAQIAATLSVAEADVSALRLAIETFNSVYRVVYGQQSVPAPYDFHGLWAKF